MACDLFLCTTLVHCPLENTDVRHCPEPLVVVQAVSDHPLIRDVESDEVLVLDDVVALEAVQLAEEDARRNRGGAPGLEEVQEEPQRVARVDDILHDQDVLSSDICAEIHDDADGAGGYSLGAVAGERHKAHLMRHSDLSDEICHEDERALQDAHDNHGALALIMLGHLLAQLCHLLGDLLLREQHRLDALCFFRRHPETCLSQPTCPNTGTPCTAGRSTSGDV
eukprot:CAMPEP_0114614792 /NCGR_PEP_ID=MMETSP0168-20121206/5834_1 /TAXON_ID=95228 ORGANISM="Vannella sp., Strain DIVA3 517/6/12" /NCGR_SAMPLE_ID=MMETSP0168 /ASSEMBLY_ACC=CAM_ASM_000044 /LENGTH=223 /DNA_ID=CAMNT_0001825847 /DNA_START=67 /DNA_END=735 /DNA_ORIENTATION=+